MSTSDSVSPVRIAAGIVVILIAVFTIGLAVSSKIVTANSDYTTACVVTDKDRAANKDGKSDMRIYTENCGTLNVKDNFLKGAWNSSDVYAEIEVGKTYDFTATGFRIPFLSIFPGITAATEV